MTLPKSRKITVNDTVYKWKVGKFRQEDDGLWYTWVYIELPDGSIKKFEECLGVRQGKTVQYPVIPDTVRNIIQTNLG